MLENILLVIEVLVCIALIGVILLQRSEGGALGMGSGPSGMFTARGAGDLLTRTTSILAGAFFVLALVITLLAGHSRSNSSVTQRLKVGSEDLSAFSSAPASGAAPEAPAAPPLPGAAPPLPGAAPQALPGQAPRPSLAKPVRPLTTTVPLAQLPGVGVAPTPLPRPNLDQPAAPAQGAKQ